MSSRGGLATSKLGSIVLFVNCCQQSLSLAATPVHLLRWPDFLANDWYGQRGQVTKSPYPRIGGRYFDVHGTKVRT
jgi:hypothetical protein